MKNETIWIIGASSGIGRDLALALDKEGAKLVLSARRKDELEALNLEMGGKHCVMPLNITESEEVLKISQAITPLHRVIFMVAIYAPTSLKELDLEATRKIFEVNVMGAFNIIHAVLPIFRAQNYGQIAITASVAGYYGLPKGQPYSATKAALINLTESLRAELPLEIDVKLINPGFVATPMTAKNSFKMPLIITSQEAAAEIVRGLKSKSFEIHFPKKFTWGLKAIYSLPYFLVQKILKKI